MGNPQLNPASAVRSARIIWAALLAGQVLFLVVVLVLMPKPAPQDQELPKLLALVAGVLVISGIPVGMMLRKKMWDAGRVDGVLQPSSYISGHVLFLALCEGPSLLALVSVLLAGSVFPFVLPSLVAMAVQIANYPTGEPLGV